ncbi:hypothetical protein BGW37DRAFT_477507 [Umbelopsis sp. PMI_123]|nr:hypothetical protein BGW37DRAFT_477507 [Umbelopsis sp. PMI_123]
MSEYRRLCGCIRIRWAAVIAEMVLMAISIVALTLGGLYGSVITGRSAFPIVIIHLCVYSPLIAFTAIGTAAITQRDGHGMALSIKALYINIAVIAIVEVIDIILLATSRKFAIVTECQYRNLEHTDILDYLTDPIATSLDINNSCEKFWTNALLGYILEFLISFVIMVQLTFIEHGTILVCSSVTQMNRLCVS